MSAPPFEAGALQNRLTCPLPADAKRFCGALGIAAKAIDAFATTARRATSDRALVATSKETAESVVGSVLLDDCRTRFLRRKAAQECRQSQT